MGKTQLEKATTKLIKDLSKIQSLCSNGNTFMKIYYYDDENYTVKFINKETNNKVHTIRKSADRSLKAFDNKFWEKKPNGKLQKDTAN